MIGMNSFREAQVKRFLADKTTDNTTTDLITLARKIMLISSRARRMSVKFEGHREYYSGHSDACLLCAREVLCLAGFSANEITTFCQPYELMFKKGDQLWLNL